MQPCSREYALISNLRNAALDHKEHCEHNCNVSLFQLKDAAMFIYKYMELMQIPDCYEAYKLVEEMPII